MHCTFKTAAKQMEVTYKVSKLQVIAASLADEPAYLAATPTSLITRIYTLPVLSNIFN